MLVGVSGDPASGLSSVLRGDLANDRIARAQSTHGGMSIAPFLALIARLQSRFRLAKASWRSLSIERALAIPLGVLDGVTVV